MRGTLFKAKSKDDGKWVEGYYVKLNWAADDLHVIIPENTEMYSGNNIDIIIEIDPDTICTIENDGWIPVEERVPEEEGYKVIVCRKQGNIDTGIYSPYTKQWFIGNIGALGKDIIAWRPLPESYRPEPAAAQRPEWKDRMLRTFLGGHK